MEEAPEIDVEGSVSDAEDGDALADSSSASDTCDYKETFSAARPPMVTAREVVKVAAALTSSDMLSATDMSGVAMPPGMMHAGATTVGTNRNRPSFANSHSNGNSLTSATIDTAMLGPRPQPMSETALPSKQSSFFKSPPSYPPGSPQLTTNPSDASTALPSGYTTDPSRRGSALSRDASGFMPLDPTDEDPSDAAGPEGVGGGLDVSALELGHVTTGLYGAGGGGSEGGGGGGGASRHAVRRSISLTPAFNSPVLSPAPSPVVVSKVCMSCV